MTTSYIGNQPNKSPVRYVAYGTFDQDSDTITVQKGYQSDNIEVVVGGTVLDQSQYTANDGVTIQLDQTYGAGTHWRVDEYEDYDSFEIDQYLKNEGYEDKEQLDERSNNDRNRENHFGTQTADTITSSSGFNLQYILDNPPAFNASDFGFSTDNNQSENRQAIQDAVDAANGGEVVVHADKDFHCAHLQVRNQHLNLKFTGKGRVITEGRDYPVISHFADLLGIQSAVLGKESNVTIDGSVSNYLVTVTVEDASQYARADIVKLVSDDIDGAASSSTARRRGEFAVVADVSGNKIYLANDLEQYDQFQTNVRIAKMQKDIRSTIRGLRFKSSFSSTSMLAYASRLYNPIWEIVFEEHGSICCNATSCHSGEFYLQGWGKGDSTGSLGYLFNDNNGYNNRVIRPLAQFFRHVTTTNFNGTEADGDPGNYGGTVEHTVIDGVALSCQGPAWDDHEGARRTRWINCKAFGSIDNDATQRNAFNPRGKDAQIINGYCDSNFEHMCRIGDYTIGSLTLINPNSLVPLFDDISTYPRSDFEITVDGGRSKAVNEERGFGSRLSNHAIIRNHRLDYIFDGTPNCTVLRNTRTTQRLVIENCTFYIKLTKASEFARVIADNGVDTDVLIVRNSDFFISNEGGRLQNFVYGRSGKGFGSISCRVHGISTGGGTNSQLAGGSYGDKFKYILNFPSASFITKDHNVTDFDEYLTFFGA